MAAALAGVAAAAAGSAEWSHVWTKSAGGRALRRLFLVARLNLRLQHLCKALIKSREIGVVITDALAHGVLETLWRECGNGSVAQICMLRFAVCVHLQEEPLDLAAGRCQHATVELAK